MARLRAVPRLSKTLVLTLAVILLLVLVPPLLLMRAGGVFRPVDYGYAGSCETIALPGVARDIQVDRERGVAYLSVLDRDSGNGTVMLLDLNLPSPAPRAAMSRDPPAFSPIGISLSKAAGQPTRLFVVSKTAGGIPALEIAEQDANGAFVPMATLRGPAIGNPSLVAAAGRNSFLLVEHHEPPTALERKVSLLFQSGRDSIMFSDGDKTDAAVGGLSGVSGLARSPDGSHLYVGELSKQRLGIYREREGGLVLERTVALGSPAGRLSVDEEGVIWMTAYPKVLRYFAALDGVREVVPTQVLRVDPRQADARPVQVFADDGARISGGTAVASWRGELLIGSEFDKKVLICKPAP